MNIGNYFLGIFTATVGFVLWLLRSRIVYSRQYNQELLSKVYGPLYKVCKELILPSLKDSPSLLEDKEVQDFINQNIPKIPWRVWLLPMFGKRGEIQMQNDIILKWLIPNADKLKLFSLKNYDRSKMMDIKKIIEPNIGICDSVLLDYFYQLKNDVEENDRWSIVLPLLIRNARKVEKNQRGLEGSSEESLNKAFLDATPGTIQEIISNGKLDETKLTKEELESAKEFQEKFRPQEKIFFAKFCLYVAFRFTHIRYVLGIDKKYNPFTGTDLPLKNRIP